MHFQTIFCICAIYITSVYSINSTKTNTDVDLSGLEQIIEYAIPDSVKNLHLEKVNSTGAPKAQFRWQRVNSEVAPQESAGFAEGDMIVPYPIERDGAGDYPLSDLNLRWPGAVVPYVISGDFSGASRQRILDAMRRISEHSCVRFVPHDGSSTAHIFIFTRPDQGCWSFIGRISTNRRQEVSLNQEYCMTRGIIIHELLHALGFLHEQSRPDRDDYVTVHYENIQDDAKHNFDKRARHEVYETGTQYDLNSLMHYGESDFAKRQGLKTITPKRGGVSIGHKDDASSIDWQELNIYYQCNAPKVNFACHKNIRAYNHAAFFDNVNSINDCNQKCSSDSRCNLITYSGNYCFLYYTDYTLGDDNGGWETCYNLDKNRPAIRSAKYTCKDGNRAFGHMREGKTPKVEDCVRWCLQHESCQTVTFWQEQEMCYLYDKGYTLSENNSGWRTCYPTPN